LRELAVSEAANKYLFLRTSWLYSEFAANFKTYAAFGRKKGRTW
jgi:dTDP-4-dehydrorhamnose reductase